VWRRQLVFKEDDCWYQDTDDPEEAQRLVRALKRLWNDLLKETDAALEIDPEV
jgi:hypothetical protein